TSYVSSECGGESPHRSAPAAAGRCRYTRASIDTTTPSDEMTIAVGTPKNVQFPVRRVSSAMRTIAYQIRNTRNRSPGRIRGPHRRAIHSSAIAPMIPLTDSYRNSGWKNVESKGYDAHGYSDTPCSQSIAMPQGSVVGGPYSSWLKKFPQRPTACMTNRPGAITSAPFQNDCFHSRVMTMTAIVPVRMPP